MKTTENDNTLSNYCEIDHLFLPKDELELITAKYGTPLHLYNEKGLCQRAQSLLSGFPGVIPSVAVGKCPWKAVLRVLAEAGIGAYCETWKEFCLALDSGFPGDRILYAAIRLSEEQASLLRKTGAGLLAAGREALAYPLPERVDMACSVTRSRKNCLAPNAHRRAHIGFTRQELWELLPRLGELGAKSVGLAVIRSGNTTNEGFFAELTDSLRKLAEEAERDLGITIDRLNPGEGPGTQYRRLVPQVNISQTAKLTESVMDGFHGTLCGQFSHWLLDPCAILVTRVLGILDRSCPTVMVDASARHLLCGPLERYRHVSVAGKEWIRGRTVCDVIGCIASPGDWLAEQHTLMLPETGDLMVFHDVGTAVPPESEIPCLLYRDRGEVTELTAW